MYISNVNSSSIKLHSIEGENITASEAFKIQSDSNLMLIYMNKGAATYTSISEQGEFKKRDILILNPENEITIDPIRKIEWIKVTLSGILFTSSLAVDSDNHLFIVDDSSQMVKNYLDLALAETNHRFRGSEIVMKKLVECIMVHILRNSELSIKDSSLQIKHDEIDRVQEYIREHYPEKITLDQLSDNVGINKYYLIRLFKQKTGLSPIDYLIHVRLAEAEKLLAKSNVTISKISDLVGFHSPSHFSKSFKESNHCTPSAYRKKYSQT